MPSSPSNPYPKRLSSLAYFSLLCFLSFFRAVCLHLYPLGPMPAVLHLPAFAVTCMHSGMTVCSEGEQANSSSSGSIRLLYRFACLLQLDEVIGLGSFSCRVYRATDILSGVRRVVKRVSRDQPEGVRLFRNEITFLRKAHHPNIVRLFEVFEDPAAVYHVRRQMILFSSPLGFCFSRFLLLSSFRSPLPSFLPLRASSCHLFFPSSPACLCLPLFPSILCFRLSLLSSSLAFCLPLIFYAWRVSL